MHPIKSSELRSERFALTWYEWFSLGVFFQKRRTDNKNNNKTKTHKQKQTYEQTNKKTQQNKDKTKQDKTKKDTTKSKNKGEGLRCLTKQQDNILYTKKLIDIK